MTETMDRDALKWLDWNNEKQMKWALRYFGTKLSLALPLGSIPRDTTMLRVYIENLPLDDSALILLSKAKNAWRQQKHRKQNPGHKSYNFVLPTAVQATLKQLADKRGSNMTEALKELIGEALEAEKHHQKELKSLQLQAQKQLTEQKKSAEQKIKSDAIKLNDFNRATKELAEEIRKLMWHKVESELGISRQSATQDEIEILNELHAEQIQTLNRRLKMQGGIDAFSNRPIQQKTQYRPPSSESPKNRSRTS